MCLSLVSGRCKYEQIAGSECPNISGNWDPPCTTLMRNDEICEGDNRLPDGQEGGWINTLDNCASGSDVFKCFRGKFIFDKVS